MKLVIIIGPHAVGKMTVGQEIEKRTDLKLFHNHMTIELVAPLFGFGRKSPIGTKLVDSFREQIFEEFAKSNQEGMIFTCVWAFNKKSDWDYIENLCNLFKSNGSEVYFVELEADLDVRLKRNKHPDRLKYKPSKRNIEWSEKDLMDSMKRNRLNSNHGEIKYEQYLKINNTSLSSSEVAEKIIRAFHLS